MILLFHTLTTVKVLGIVGLSFCYVRDYKKAACIIISKCNFHQQTFLQVPEMQFSPNIFVCRSVSLVGEGERKMLKEVVKRAKVPAKSRILPQYVVVRYRDRIRKLAPEIKAIVKEEKEEREVYIHIYCMVGNLRENTY